MASRTESRRLKFGDVRFHGLPALSRNQDRSIFVGHCCFVSPIDMWVPAISVLVVLVAATALLDTADSPARNAGRLGDRSLRVPTVTAL